MVLKRLSASAGKDAILKVMRDEGGLIVEGLFDPAVIQQMWDVLADKRAEHGPGSSIPVEDSEVFWGRNTIRFASLAQHSDAFIEVMLTPLVHEVGEAFLEEAGGVDYWMNTAQFIGIGPGEPHRSSTATTTCGSASATGPGPRCRNSVSIRYFPSAT